MNYDLICVINDKKSGFFQTDTIKETLGEKITFIEPMEFNNKETNIEISLPSNVKKVLLVGRVMDSANEFVMNMMFAIDACKRQEVDVDLFIPCLPYARQDRRNGRDVAITSQVMLRMFEQAGIGKLYVVDLHSTQMEGFAKFPIINIDSMPILIESIKKRMKFCEGQDFVIVSPDAGGVKRAKKYADLLGLNMAIIHKSRDPFTNESTSHNVVGEVDRKYCIVVDDMVDTGGTLVDAQRLLFGEGASAVSFMIGHPVLSKPRKELEEMDIVTLNTVPDINDIVYCRPIEEYFLNKYLNIELLEKEKDEKVIAPRRNVFVY